MADMATDYKKTIENTALAAGTIVGVIGALTGSGGLSAVAFAPVVIEKIILAGYDQVSPAIKRQFYSAMKKTFKNVEKKLKKADSSYDQVIVDLFCLVGQRVEKSTGEYSLQGLIGEISDNLRTEAKWNDIPASESQINTLVELIVKEFIEQTGKYNELSNYLNARGLLVHELALIKHEQDITHNKMLLAKHEQQIRHWEEIQEQMNLHPSELKNKILSASIREYNQLHVENNKFHGLRIYEKLFPSGYELPRYYEGYGTFENESVIPVEQIYEATGNSHIALIGEGGIGKTTFLAHLMERLLTDRKDNTQIPVYIELNKCPRRIGKWISEKYGKSNFITRYIASSITGQEFDTIDGNLLASIEVLLRYRSQDQEEPSFLLLMDGLNEVSRSVAEKGNGNNSESVREILEHEISAIAKYSNVRIILTSRKIDRGYLPHGLKYIGLRGLKKDDILEHLRERSFSEMEINSIAIDNGLLEILRIPLFLCMYASNGTGGHIQPSTRGEILCDFFHRTGEHYAERRNIDDRYGKTRFEKTQLSFIMNFILPYIGSVMEGSYVFSFSREALRECIQGFFEDEEIPFWNERTSLFPDFETGSVILHQVFLEMKNTPDLEIIDCIVNMLGIMTRDIKQSYSFIHQHVRDYFAAYYEVQCLRSATGLWNAGVQNQDEIIGSLGEIYSEVWEEEKQVFIGEILREHRNAPILGDDNIWCLPQKETTEQCILSDIMEIFRYKNCYCGYTLYNIVEIMKHARKNLAGICFDGLDLTECRLYGASFVLGEENPLCASFKDTVIQDETILPEGHLESIIAIEESTDGGTLYTLGNDGCLKIWDVQQERCLSTLEVGEFNYSQTQANRLFFVPDSKLGFLIKHYEFEEPKEGNYSLEDEDRSLIHSELRYYTGERGKYYSYKGPEYEEPKVVAGIWDMCFEPEEQYLAGLWEDGAVLLFDKKSEEYIALESVSTEGHAVRITMPDKNNIYVIVLKDAEEKTDTPDYVECTYAVLNLKADWKEDGSCHFSSLEEVLRFSTVYDYNSQNDLPAFDFSPDGTCVLYYSSNMFPEWGPAIVNTNLQDGGTELIMRFSDGIPESAEFITNKDIIIHWKDSVALYSADQGRITVHRNEKLCECRRVLTTINESYILSSYNTVYRWLMLQGTTKEVFSQINIDVNGLSVEPVTGMINVEFADSSILRLDANGRIVSSIYYPEYDLQLETSWYISGFDLIISAFRGDGYEKILVHYMKTGLTKQIHLDFTEKTEFRSAYELQNGILLGFDNKLVLISSDNKEAKEIWQSAAGEALLSVEVENEKVYLLIEKNDGRNTDILPEYHVFCKNGNEYVMSEKTSAILIDEQDMAYFQNDGIGVEQYSTGESENGIIYQERGVFLNLNKRINEAFKASGLNAFQLHTVFFKINDFHKYCEERFSEDNHDIIMDITDQFILISDMGSGLKLYRINHLKASLVSEINVKEKENQEFCFVKNAVIGDEDGSYFYCILDGMTIAKVRSSDGVIEWKRQWIPGINIIGCDFRGVTYTSQVEKLLEIMGVIR